MNNLLLLTIMKPSILAGGQAVINGIMMRVPGAYATAVEISYEIIKLCSRTENILLVWLQKPGFWLQNITTNPPGDNMIVIAIKALKSAFGENYEEVSKLKFKAKAIG